MNNTIRKEELMRRIATLPSGTLTKKNVKGHEYWYLRHKVDGKRHEQYIPLDKVDTLRTQIAERNALLQELNSLSTEEDSSSTPSSSTNTSPQFEGTVLTGAALKEYAAPVASFQKRELFSSLQAYLNGSYPDKVFVLCGLRRTGKTTLIRQALLSMNADELSHAAFVQITSFDTLAQLNRDLGILATSGFRTVFIDEVTLLEDFVEGAALFSDVFATRGMKIVLSGTDSLGFVFAESEQLYDRCVMARTTFIPYREFERVLGIADIDEYLRYGGTMSLGSEDYHTQSIFADERKAGEYVNSAIARNIQHSLKCYQDGNHFRGLQELYDAHELTSVINRVVEDINHRFTLDVLSRDFKSNDLRLSARNLRKDRVNPTDILDKIDVTSVTERLKNLLEIRDSDDRFVVLSKDHASEIEEYLTLLDLVAKVEIVSLTDTKAHRFRTIIAQPGLRYAQAEALVKSLLADSEFLDLSLSERNRVLARVTSEIEGRMMEDLLLLETTLAQPQNQVFVLQFAVGEFDMVIFNPMAASCEIYEIKHSDIAVPQQYRYLVDDEKCAATEHRFGPITARRVIYRGKSFMDGTIEYVNVEEYLNSLGQDVA